jgi:hypothetical protein
MSRKYLLGYALDAWSCAHVRLVQEFYLLLIHFRLPTTRSTSFDQAR